MHLFGKSKSHKKKDSANKALTLSLIPNDNIMDLFENLDEEDDKKKWIRFRIQNMMEHL